jgi:hypothetical protein
MVEIKKESLKTTEKKPNEKKREQTKQKTGIRYYRIPVNSATIAIIESRNHPNKEHLVVLHNNGELVQVFYYQSTKRSVQRTGASLSVYFKYVKLL